MEGPHRYYTALGRHPSRFIEEQEESRAFRPYGAFFAWGRIDCCEMDLTLISTLSSRRESLSLAPLLS